MREKGGGEGKKNGDLKKIETLIKEHLKISSYNILLKK